MKKKSDFFKRDEIDNKLSQFHVSPDEKYMLLINSYMTGKGTWNYTSGEVYAKDKGKIFEVQRNYSEFPYAFVCNHSNGHDYLICGENYQGDK